MKIKAITTKTTAKGRKLALCAHSTELLTTDGTFTPGPTLYGVWALCANYDGKVHGGMRHTWRYIKKDLTEADARALFLRRTR